MEQSKHMEEIDVWDHPLKSGIILNEERNKKFLEENQTNSLVQTLFKMTQHEMLRKPRMISGLLREISFIAITWDPESKCICRKKHFLFRWTTSTIPEPLTRHWMYCWKNILMITGTWMESENCQMHGLASKDLIIERKATWWIHIVLGEIDEETNNLKTRQCMSRYVDAYVWCSKKQSEAKMGCRETEAR